MHSFVAGLAVGKRDFKRAWTVRTWVFGWAVRIISNALVWIYLGSLIGSESQTSFLLIGNAVLAGIFSITWTIPAATWDRSEGIYPLLSSSPANAWAVMTGRTSVWLFNGILTTCMSLLILGIGFNNLPTIQTLPLLVLAIVLTCASVYTATLFFGVIARQVPRVRIIFSNLLQIFFMTFCGVSVPVSFWPPLIQWITPWVPLTHGLNAIRLIYTGADTLPIAIELITELSVACAWLCSSFFLYTALNRYSRNYGDIEII